MKFTNNQIPKWPSADLLTDAQFSFHHTPLAVGGQARVHAHSPLPDSAYCLPQFLQRAVMLALQALY